MNREELNELHYIAHIRSVPSIMVYGILSHRGAERLKHKSIAKSEIQERRAKKRVPGGLWLHDYANLYICARNPMLFVLVKTHERTELCVLRVSAEVLDMPGVVITDVNAAKDFVRFIPSPEGLSIVDKNSTFAEYWADANPIAAERKKGATMAEVLVPKQVDPSFITGAYVSCAKAEANLRATGAAIAVIIRPHLFFK